MGLITDEKIAVVNCSNGLQIETYQSSLAMVLSVMNHGGIGGGNGYGCDEHKTALDTIEKHLAYVRGRIEEHNKEDGGKPSED